jgi:transposase
MDETMFGGRKLGNRRWGALGKNIVFGIYPDAVKSLLFLSHL